MGLVKTIYNVLGGFYMDYNSTFRIISVHKLHKRFKVFLCIFYPLTLLLAIFGKICIKKPDFCNPVLFLLLYSNNASNSSLEIFSFSSKSSAQLSKTPRYSKIISFAFAQESSIMRLISASMVSATPSLQLLVCARSRPMKTSSSSFVQHTQMLS